jgi:DNA-binding GntR family transcriptional regulator
VPKYHEIADELRERILAGSLGPGQVVPSEAELVAAYAVSRSTVRLALGRLIDEGLLVTEQGRGTFVRQRPEPIVWDPSSPQDTWTAAVLAAGRQPGQDLLVAVVAAPPGVAAALSLADGAGEVVRRRRIRSVDGEPYLLVDDYFPTELADGTPLAQPHDVVDLGAALAAVGLPVMRYRDELRVRAPARTEIQALRLPPGTAVLERTRTGRPDAGDPAVHVAVTVVPGDRHVLTFDRLVAPVGDR